MLSSLPGVFGLSRPANSFFLVCFFNYKGRNLKSLSTLCVTLKAKCEKTDMINRMPKPKSFLWPSVSLCSHWHTVLTATGSPLIRIMAKSIAGTARGPVHAPLYKSEANSCVSETVRAFAWRNIKTGKTVVMKQRSWTEIKVEGRWERQGALIQGDWKAGFFLGSIHQASRIKPRLDQMLTS